MLYQNSVSWFYQHKKKLIFSFLFFYFIHPKNHGIYFQLTNNHGIFLLKKIDLSFDQII
jgi:hypothetical protein